jgi:membrane protein DedA with SNARE-associated domain
LGHLLEALGSWIRGVISLGGYPGIVLLMAIESACVPLPSELIMPFAGALTTVAVAQAAHRAPLDLHMVALAGAVGCALGSALAYWVGAKGGREFVFRYGKYILLKRKDVESADRWFQRQGPAAVFLSRLLPVVRTFISLPAGISRMSFWPFLALSFLGSLPWCYLLAYIGIKFADNLDALKKYFHGADLLIGILLLSAFGYWLWHHLKPDREEPAGTAAG